MNEIDPANDRLVRILSASRATADDAVLTRARTRLAGARERSWLLEWFGTPAALAAACALFVAVAGVSIAVVGSDTSSARETTLMSALVGDDGSYGLPAATATSAGSGPADSGTVTP